MNSVPGGPSYLCVYACACVCACVHACVWGPAQTCFGDGLEVGLEDGPVPLSAEGEGDQHHVARGGQLHDRRRPGHGHPTPPGNTPYTSHIHHQIHAAHPKCHAQCQSISDEADINSMLSFEKHPKISRFWLSWKVKHVFPVTLCSLNSFRNQFDRNNHFFKNQFRAVIELNKSIGIYIVSL